MNPLTSRWRDGGTTISRIWGAAIFLALSVPGRKAVTFRGAIVWLFLVFESLTFAGTLTGRVRDLNWYARYQANPFGVGYYEYGVNANGQNVQSAGGLAATDVFGAFSMPNLAAGSYTVSSWDVWWRPAFAFNVPVPAVGTTPEVDLRLHATMWGYPAFWDETGWHEFGQTFVATGPIHMIYLRAPFATTYTLTVREGAPGGARVTGSPERVFNGGGDVRVIYGYGEMPTVAGQTYYVRIRTSAPTIGGVLMQMEPRPDFSDPMPGGMLFVGNNAGVVSHPDRDLGLVIMCDDDGILTNLHTRPSGGQNFFGTSVGQSFVARGVGLISAALWLADPSAPTYVVRVLQNGPGGAQVGTTKRGKPPRLNADPEMVVTWAPGECPLQPNQTYYLEVTKDGGGSFSSVYTDNSNPFAFGNAFLNGSPQAAVDLAGTLMEEEAVGSATAPTVKFTSDPVVAEGERLTTTLTIRWQTDVPSDSTVELAEDVPPYTRVVRDAALTTNHSLVITGLTSHTLHHYRVTSAAAGYRPGIFRDQVICTRPAAQNLLTNAGFESGTGGSPRPIIDWATTGTIDLKQSDGSWFFSMPPHGGNWHAQGAVNGSSSDGTVFQRVTGTVPGRKYTFSAWVTTWARENNTFKYDVWQDRNRMIYVRLGIDPTGGTDPNAGSVQWTPRMYSHLHWTNFARSAVARNNAVTVFVSLKGEGVEWHLYGIDDAVLSTEGPEPLPQLRLVVADRQASTLRLTFSDALDANAAANIGNYRVTESGSGLTLAVLNAQVVDAFTIVLTTGAQKKYVDYLVEPQNISGPTTPLPPPFSNGAQPLRNGHTLIALDAATHWKFDQSGSDLATGWRAREFNDASWLSGPALLGQETTALAEPIRTPLTVATDRFTFYFRRHFDAPVSVPVAPLRIRHMIDDGAVFYLNGERLHAIGIDEPVANFTPATRLVDNAAYEGPFDLPERALLTRDNVLAAEVHQTNGTSADVVFGAILEALVLPSQLPRPVLSITPLGENVRLDWNAPGAILQRTDTISGPWTDIVGATSPWFIPIDRAQSFFRLAE